MKILYLDLETAPHLVMAWGLFNQTIRINQIKEPGYTLCWAAKWEGQKEVMFRKLGDDDFIAELWDIMDGADAVVTYNGERFDIPIVHREFLENGFPPPDPSASIDLYKPVKSRFRFASNKLDFVCQQLGIGAKVQHKGQDLWTECMEGDEKAWAIMERYNKQDVRLLPKLYKRLLPWIKDHPNYGLYVDTDRPACTNCGSTRVVKKGLEHTKTQSYQRYRCTKCHTPLRGRFTTVPASNRENILVQSK